MDKRVTPYQTNGICMSHYYCLAGNNVLTNRVQRRITVFVQFIYLLGMKFNHIVNSANTNWRRYCNVQKTVLFLQKAWSSLNGVREEGTRKGTISQYFTTLHCPVCDELTQLGVCEGCRAEPQRVAVQLHQDLRLWESQQDQILKVRGHVVLVLEGHKMP